MEIQFKSEEIKERFQKVLIENIETTIKNNFKIQSLKKQSDLTSENDTFLKYKDRVCEKLFDEVGLVLMDKIQEHFVETDFYNKLYAYMMDSLIDKQIV